MIEIKVPSAKTQYLAALTGNLLMLCNGLVLGWPIFLPLLMSDESPLPTGRITLDEASWMVSIPCFGTIFGCVFFAYLTRNFGRKKPLFVVAVPFIIHSFLVIFARNVTYVYVARFLIGFSGGGIFMILPIFITEIANEKIRGTLGSIFVFSANAGILMGNILGGYCDYNILPLVVLAGSTLFIVLFIFFPEPPITLLKQNRVAATEKSICFYNNLHAYRNHDLVQSELDKVKSIIFGDDKNQMESLRWSDFCRIESRRALTIGIVLITMNQFCGVFAMISYAVKIFQESSSSLSPVASTITVAASQLIGSYAPAVLADRIGRKYLIIISAVGTALAQMIMGTYLALEVYDFDVSDLSWLPIGAFSMIVFFANWGVMSMPFLIISEILPEKVKDIGTLFCMSLLAFLAFVMLKCFPYMNETFGMHVCAFLFAGFCVSGASIIAFIMPETNGKTPVEIQKILQKR